MRPSTRVGTLLLLVGCASSPSSEPASLPSTQTISMPPEARLGGESGLVTLTRSDATTRDSISAPPARALAALRAAYEGAGIPVTVDEPAAGRVGNTNLVVRGTLRGTALSAYVQCGSTITGERANSDRLYLSVVSTVRPLPGGSSAVATRVTGTAVDMSGSASDRQPCASTGKLEALVNARAQVFAAAH